VQRTLIAQGATRLEDQAVAGSRDTPKEKVDSVDSLRHQLAQTLRTEIATGITSLGQLADHRLIITIGSHAAFSPGSAELKRDFRATLDRLSGVLVHYPNTTLYLSGHTSSTGLVEYNELLSRRRAQNIGDYLKFKGVSPAGLRVAGHGSSQPVASDDTISGQAANERVEILVDTLGAVGSPARTTSSATTP
jgi:outer membrane protein OmpA-like peptidoglycan-associated protein